VPIKAGSEKLEQDAVKVTSPVLGRGEGNNPFFLYDKIMNEQLYF